MNPVFVFLVILAAILVWMMLSGVYKYIGAFFDEIFRDIKTEMSDTDVIDRELDKEKEDEK